MRHLILTSIFLLAAVLAVQAHASYPAKFYTFIGNYIPNSTVSSSTFTNESVNGSTYVVIALPGDYYTVVNTTSSTYSLVLNTSTLFYVLKPYAAVRFAPNSTEIAQLNASMNDYLGNEQTSSTPIWNLTTCLYDIGYETGLPCTTQDYCESCNSYPECRSYSQKNGLYADEGLANFTYWYNQFNSSISAYYSTLASINSSNSYSKLRSLQNITGQVLNTSMAVQDQYILPIPIGYSVNVSACSNIVIPNGPWYCWSYLQYCPFSPGFNYNIPESINSTISSMLAVPTTDAQIQALAANVSAYTVSLLSPRLHASLSAVINATYNEYSGITSNSSTLSAHFHNATLSSALQRLQGTYSQLLDYNYATNASTYNTTIRSEMANLSAVYGVLYPKYSTLEGLSSNDTGLITRSELEYRKVPQSVLSLAASDNSIRSMLSSGINSTQYAAVYANLSSIKSSLGSAYVISMPALVESVDGGLVSGILSGSNASIPSKLAAAPFYIMAVTAAIAALIILIVYFATFHRLSKRKRLHLHRKAKRAWLMLFIVLAIIGVAVSCAGYAFASQANTFLPFSGFLAQVSSHSNVTIAFNSTSAASTNSIDLCAQALQSTLTSQKKSVQTIILQNYSCTDNTGSPYCYDRLLGSGTPVIVLGMGNSSIVYRGIYGHELYASGSDADGSSCFVNSALRVS